MEILAEYLHELGIEAPLSLGDGEPANDEIREGTVRILDASTNWMGAGPATPKASKVTDVVRLGTGRGSWSRSNGCSS